MSDIICECNWAERGTTANPPLETETYRGRPRRRSEGGGVAGERAKEGVVVNSGRLPLLGRIRVDIDIDLVEGGAVRAASLSEGGRGQLCLELGRGDVKNCK